MSVDQPFTKENLEYYLKELAKEYKKRSHGLPAEIILVGGAAVMINYSFRESSYDIDADYDRFSVLKESINAVGDKLGLSNGWINDDFRKTASYSNGLVQYSSYYKTFSGVLQIRTVKAEFLIAMKLKSGRQYKNDLSDIAGILYEQKQHGDEISYDRIDNAVRCLYGGWDGISDFSRRVLDKLLSCDNLGDIFDEIRKSEIFAKDVIVETEKKYPGVVKTDNVNDIIELARVKKEKNIKS